MCSDTVAKKNLMTAASTVGVTPSLASTPVAEGGGGQWRIATTPAIEPRDPAIGRSRGGQLGSVLRDVGFRKTSGVFCVIERGSGYGGSRRGTRKAPTASSFRLIRRGQQVAY